MPFVIGDPSWGSLINLSLRSLKTPKLPHPMRLQSWRPSLLRLPLLTHPNYFTVFYLATRVFQRKQLPLTTPFPNKLGSPIGWMTPESRTLMLCKAKCSSSAFARTLPNDFMERYTKPNRLQGPLANGPQSSGLALIQMALNYRDGALANQPVVGSAFALRPQYWTRSPVSVHVSCLKCNSQSLAVGRVAADYATTSADSIPTGTLGRHTSRCVFPRSRWVISLYPPTMFRTGSQRKTLPYRRQLCKDDAFGLRRRKSERGRCAYLLQEPQGRSAMEQRWVGVLQASRPLQRLVSFRDGFFRV